ncbi:MAG: VWA domain-containing protein [Proteobacteria bacterium]|nr:VWA domain-containing protein [Pseudomonadota bacterium]
MKKHPLGIALLITSVLVLVCAGVVLANLLDAAKASSGSTSARQGIVTLNAGLTQTKVQAAGESTLGLALTLGCDKLDTTSFAPRNVDLVVVLDRSGSMAGRKIEDARSAVLELVRNLGPGDRFALVSYADDVIVHGSLTPVTDQTRPLLSSMAMSIRAGGGTNLSGGLAAGMELLAQTGYHRSEPGSRGKVILISDGHANQGITDPLALGQMASGSYQGDFSLTTVGVGVDYNENLMGVIADHGGGNYYFLENPARFAQLFLDELSLTRAVAVRNLELRVPLPEGVVLRDAAGYPVEMQGNTVVIRPGGLRSGQERTIFITLSLLNPQPGRRYDISDVSAAFQRGEIFSEVRLAQPLSVEAVDDRAAALASINPLLWERQTVQEDYNRLREEVSRDVAQGDKDTAMAKIQRYEQEKGTLNVQVKSEAVAENLTRDLAGLKQSVEDSLAPSAAPEMRKQVSKAMQSESYDLRRSKTKY